MAGFGSYFDCVDFIEHSIIKCEWGIFMKLTVLVDNFTYIDQYYHGEPAAAYYLELEDKRILFDTGYSEIVLSNAEKMGIDLSKLTHIVFSHGHDDHTRGFKFLADKIDLANVEVIAHPACFLPKYSGDLYIGAPYSLQEMQAKTNFKPLAESYALTDKLIYLGQIPRTNDYENKEPIGSYEQDGKREADYLLDDTALAYRTNEGLFIITGCSHSGICNIIEYAKKVCGEEELQAMAASSKQLRKRRGFSAKAQAHLRVKQPLKKGLQQKFRQTRSHCRAGWR